jgi:hypothetical protein
MFMCNFWKVHFSAVIMRKKNLAYISLHFFRNMSSRRSQRKVRQRTDEGIAATRAKVETRPVIIERNVQLTLWFFLLTLLIN